jgi:hypothetical protein
VQKPAARSDGGDQPRAPRRRIAARAAGGEDAQLVLGRYRLLEELGSGGFGTVWQAHDELLHRDVALKRVPLGAARPGAAAIDGERASREALATARLSHPAIVALHEACAHEGAFYLISELVDGDTLAALIAEDALEDEEVLEIGVALASALVHAHARGVIHRDIKPQNVLVPSPPGDGAHAAPALHAAAKLTDFGGASLVGEEALTRTGDVLGTLAYMAPEQSEGHEATAQSDLYSLALVLYEALCGTNPVRGATPASTARRIGRPLPPLARARRDLPPALTRALDRALAPQPERRGTLEELRATLQDTLDRGLGRPRWRRPRAPAAPGAPRLLARMPQTAEQPPREPPAVEPLPRPAGEQAAWRVPVPRTLWLGCGLALIVWQALSGRAGAALLLAAALAPLLLLSGRRSSSDAGLAWLACALAPALGWLGLAGAFPALAGQARRWPERAALGALAYWWLRLAEPLLGRRLWLGEPAGTPAHAAWEGSLSAAATHVLGPLLVLGVLLGALLWAAAAALLPLFVRGRSALRDAFGAGAWAAALALATPALDAGLAGRAAQLEPRGLVVGAALAALVAVAARAVRGPV